ncbi:MAG: thioredoxin family protein [Acidimicrobiales bacterium]|nr:thioredoxin family protein [Acidimicrobiales bacterium]
MRIVVVVVLLAAFAVAKVWYDRRSTSLSDRSSLDLPSVPDRLCGPGRTWIVFATEYCATCGPVTERLRALHPDDTVQKVMVEHDSGLADAFAVRTAPTLLEVDVTGDVVHSVAGAEAVLRHVDALAGSRG